MRNIFDQYSQPENRLTHALLSALDADRPLLRKFLDWVNPNLELGNQLEVREQSLPGGSEPLSHEIGERGLPDGCISNRTASALLIESKVAAKPDRTQIERHFATARRRGLDPKCLLWLTVRPARWHGRLVVVNRTWEETYAWLIRQRSSDWARRLVEYLEIAEIQADMKNHIGSGTLTAFTGVHFGPDQPYTYATAKRILGLLRSRLLLLPRLRKELDVDPLHPGRGAITGVGSSHVWDFVALRDLKGSGFTTHPHLTIGITDLRLEAFVTFPNNLRSRLRTQLLGADYAAFERLMESVLERMEGTLRRYVGAYPEVRVVQRHYRTQRAEPTIDAELRADLRTAFGANSQRKVREVKFQPEWLQAVYSALKARRSNLQLQVGMVFPYAKCLGVRSRDIDIAIANAWIACKPVIEAARERSRSKPDKRRKLLARRVGA